MAPAGKGCGKMNLMKNDLVSAGGRIGRIYAITDKTVFVRFNCQVYPFTRDQVKLCSSCMPQVRVTNPKIHMEGKL